MKKTIEEKTYYQKKAIAVRYLSGIKAKNISEEQFKDAAKKAGLKVGVVKYAWNNLEECSKIDRRVKHIKNHKHVLTNQISGTKKVQRFPKNNNVNYDLAASIIKEYMHNNDLNSRELCAAHKISVNQFYGWLREIEVNGTLLGKRICNYLKYDKHTIVDVIWLIKHPDTKRQSVNLSDVHKDALRRVGNVLEKYL